MTHLEFKNLVATYGANFARWPSDKVELAQAFLSENPLDARQIMASDAVLDSALNSITVSAPSDLLRQRIIKTARPAAANDTQPARRSGFLHWRSAAALMLGAFALGFGGANFMPLGQTSPEPVYAQADAAWGDAADDMGLADTYAWVEGQSTNAILSDLK